MTRIEYQQRMRRLGRERILAGLVLGALWLLAVTAVATGQVAGAGHRWVVAVVTVVGLAGAYGLWAIWIARAVKKHDLLCPNCCRSLAGKPASLGKKLRCDGSAAASPYRDKTPFFGGEFRCPHCGISIFSES